MDCWDETPSERPTFDQVTTLLEAMLMEDTPYFDPGLLDESKAHYSVVQEEEENRRRLSWKSEEP